MHEQNTGTGAAAAASLVGFASGHPIVPGWLGHNRLRGAENGHQGSGAGAGGRSDRDSRTRSRTGFGGGGDRFSPFWYRVIAATMSTGSAAALVVIWAVKGGIG